MYRIEDALKSLYAFVGVTTISSDHTLGTTYLNSIVQ